MLTIKLVEILGSQDALKELSEKKLPIKISFIVGKTLKRVAETIQDFEKARLERAKHYGVIKEDGTVQVSPENMEVFTKEITDLVAESIDLDVNKFNLVDFGDNFEIEPKYLANLEWLLDA